ncbi:MAG: hypothetical protein L0I29_16730 [Hyphomicrobiales bacterium]|nr:hypothetical protein [Hyphomicrobiales bacterium]
MPRRPKDPADVFSHSDLAIASNTTKRSVQLMADNGLLPGDRGIRDLKRICVIGAFVSAGAPILVGGRVVEKLLWSLNQSDGELPSRLIDFDRKLGPAAFPSDREISDYWRHRALLSRPDLYRSGEAFSSDFRVEIVDRQHVFTSGGIVEANVRTYEGRIEGWERGSDVFFHSIFETSQPDQWNVPPGQDHLQEASQPLFANAVGVLAINGSLAIRNGLDRLANHRAGKVSP